MDAIVTAGGIPKAGEPLYTYTQGISKALLDICGKPMVQWGLDALSQSTTITRVIVVGLDESSGVTSRHPLAYLPNQGGMLANIRAGAARSLELDPQSGHVLIVSSDIPGITGEMVDWVVTEAMRTNDDAYYNVIEQSLMEKRYPGSKRSYTHFKGLTICGGDMNVIRSTIGKENDQTWEKLISARKNVLKQASLIGFDTLFKLLFRQLTLKEAETTICRRLNLTGRAMVCPYAEVGMDVDKPFQLEIMRADLAQRAKGGS